MLNKDLKVLIDNNATFNDISNDMEDYLRDEVVVSYATLTDSIYIGLYKPFNTAFCELSIISDTIGVMSASINGNSITMKDDTRAFLRSGFIEFEKPDSWVAETVNGIEAYWLKLNVDVDFNATLKGLNIVFSDDNDLSKEISNLDRLLPKNDVSFIRFHTAARDEIIQTIRNGGTFKEVSKDGGNAQLENITKWDILDISEINQASLYLTLAKIYFDDSVNPEDKSYLRFRDYMDMYGKAFNLFYKKIDINDDGKYEQETELELNDIEIVIVW